MGNIICQPCRDHLEIKRTSSHPYINEPIYDYSQIIQSVQTCPKQSIEPNNSQTQSYKPAQRQNIDCSSLKQLQQQFKVVNLINQTNYSQIILIEPSPNTVTNPVLVVLKKTDLIEQSVQDIQDIFVEAKIHSEPQIKKCPFIVHQYSWFQSEENNKVYQLMEWCQGGLFINIIRRQSRVNENVYKFYIAQLFLAMEAMHQSKIIIRSLSLENIYIKSNGYICIGNFGYSKRLDIQNINQSKIEQNMSQLRFGQTTIPFCDMAPELLLDDEYGISLDYWHLGQLIYKLVNGEDYIESRSTTEYVQKALQNTNVQIKYPYSIQLQQLMESLLTRDAVDRVKRCKNFRENMFFQGLDWEAVQKEELESPIDLELKGYNDQKHMDQIMFLNNGSSINTTQL